MRVEDFFGRLHRGLDDAFGATEYGAFVYSSPSRDLPVDPKETCERYPRAC